MKAQPIYLKRNQDISGVSGTGIVAVGVQLPSGQCVIEWLTFTSSIGIYRNVEHITEVHGHEGSTEVCFGDPPQPKRKRKKNEDT